MLKKRNGSTSIRVSKVFVLESGIYTLKGHYLNETIAF